LLRTSQIPDSNEMRGIKFVDSMLSIRARVQPTGIALVAEKRQKKPASLGLRVFSNFFQIN
jgi:hypothetical protein